MLVKFIKARVIVTNGVRIFVADDFRPISPPVIIKMDELGDIWYWCEDSALTEMSASSRETIDGVEYQIRSGAFAWSGIGAVGNYVIRDSVEPDATSLYLPPNTKILVDGDSQFHKGLEITVGGGVSIRGTKKTVALNRCCIKIAATSNLVRIEDLTICNARPDGAPTQDGVVLVASQASVPSGVTVRNVRFDRCYGGLRVRGGESSTFSDLWAKGCSRSYAVYSANNCRFEKIESKATIEAGKVISPVVGFLAMTYRTLAFNRGITDCVFRDLDIDGWTEEGFSFDGNGWDEENRAVVFNGHVTGITGDGVSILGDHVPGAYIPFDCIFNTGALAGRRFAIRNNTDNTISLDGIEPYLSSVNVGDFIGIEVKCYGNLVERLNVKSIGDRSGISVWLWGGNTVYDTVSFDGCIAYVSSAANNKKISSWGNNNYYGAPHNVTFRNGTFKNQYSIDGRSVDGWIPYDPKQLCGYHFAQETIFAQNMLGDDSVTPDEMIMVGIRIEGNLPPKMQFEYVSVVVPEMRPIDAIGDGVDIIADST